MLINRMSLSANLLVLAAVIGLPYIVLWGYLFYSGRVDWGILAWVSLLLVIDGVLLILFIRGLVKPLQTVGQTLRVLASGDFTVSANNPYTGVIGQMLNDMNHAILSIQGMIEKILENTVAVTSSSFETVAASGKVVFNVEEEELHVRGISTAAEEIAATTSEVAANAADAARAAEMVNEAVKNGNVIVQETIGDMAELATSVTKAAETVQQLEVSSRQIGDITQVIGGIAEQTNLLALNAAIEAARAGEQGRGFAVVADEVRSLATRTATATREIADMVSAIQAETTRVMAAMQAGVARAQAGQESVHRAGVAFQNITQNIGTVTTTVASIADTAQGQKIATEEIAKSISVIADVAARNTAQAQTAVDVIEKMNSVIGSQLQALQQFNIANKVLLLAKSDHMLWKKRLNELLLGRTSIRPDEVTSHHACRLGKWYYGDGQAMYGDRPEFKALEEPHAKVHEIAKRVVELHQAGKKSEAIELLDTLTPYTNRVLELLDRLRTGA